MITNAKIEGLKQILGSISNEKLSDLTNVIAGEEAGIFTPEQVYLKVDDLTIFCAEYYFPQSTEVVHTGAITTDDLSFLSEKGLINVDAGQHWELFKNGESIYQIAKDIDKTDFYNILNIL